MERFNKIILLLVAILANTSVYAYDFEVDGIYYDILSVQDKTVEVTYKEYSNGYPSSDYTGDVVIPEQVQYNEELYRVTSIGVYAFYDCKELTSVRISNSVTEILDDAFAMCNNLKTVILPENLSEISASMFYKCSSLISISIPANVDYIGYRAFYGCASLTSIQIPDDCSYIPNETFWGCESLTSIAIPPNVESIGNLSFGSCSNLTSVTLPNSIKKIGANAFNGCWNIEKVYVSDLKSYLKINFANEDARPLGSSKKGGYLYVGGERLTDLIIPEGTTIVESYSFDNCNLESVTIPEGVTIIEDYAFSGCGLGASMLELPSSVEKIGSQAFGDMTFPVCRINAKIPPEVTPTSFGQGLSALIVPNGCLKSYKTEYEGIVGFKIVEGKAVEVTVPQESNLLDELIALRATPVLITDLTVHGSLKADELSWINSNMTSLLNLDISDTDCTTIPDGAFQSNGTLMGIKLPQSLQSIGNDAFNGCRALCGSITLPETVETVGDYAFQNCPLLEEILFSGSLARIGDYAFNGCSRLQSAYIPDNIEEIGRYAFSGCNSLAELFLPDGLTSINDGCFKNCGITQLKFPSSLVSIGNSAFNSSALEIVDLSGCLELKEIKDRAFIYCSSLKTVNLPASLERIGTEAFSDCKALAHISSPCVTPPVIEANANPFNNVDNTECLLSIPTESFRDYFISAYWAGFMAFEEKAEIQIEVENRNERSNGGGCAIKYRKGGKDSAQKARTVAGYAEGQTEQDGFSAVTNGGSSVFVTGSETADFEIKPDAGMRIEQILYGGEDVTGQLSGNVYSIPAVAAYDVKNLTIILSSDDLSGAEEISTESSIQVYSSGSSIIVKGSDVENVAVYNLSGQLVYGGTETTINVPAKGIYIVKVAGQTFKVAL